jgi:integrase
MDKGTVLTFRGNRRHPYRYCVQICWNGKKERFWHYPDGSGVQMFERALAERLLVNVQGAIDLHNKGMFTFRPEFYKKQSPLSLKSYSETWLASVEKKMTRKGYKIAMGHCIKKFGASFDIRGFSLSNMKEFYNGLTYEKEVDGETIAVPMSDKSRYNVLTSLRTMLRFAFRDGKLDKLPAFPKLTNPKPKDPEYLTFEEQQEILKHIPEGHRPFFEMGMEYGFRIEEVRGLMWDCVSDTHITIKRSMPGYELIEDTKEGDERVEEITPRAREALRRARLATGGKGYVFQAPKKGRGRPYSLSLMKRTWKEASDKAEEVLGFRVSVYHAFRHSYGSQLADMGLSIDVIQRCMGHKDRRSTERYTRRQRASERRLINEARGKVLEFRKKEIENGHS